MVGSSGWRLIAPDPAISRWADAALPVALSEIGNSPDPWRCGETWFVGVDALPNAEDGSVDGCPLPWARLGLSPIPLHRAQISTVRPGYPRPWSGESDAAYRFRRNRDAAHLDGLIAEGTEKRRFVREPHAWILGIPLTRVSQGASPLVLWEGSHVIMRRALLAALSDHPRDDWGRVDITDFYQKARAEVFETCSRIEVPVQPGEATLLHRLLIHGVAPWSDGATAETGMRIIAYFRPILASVSDWLHLP